MATQQFAQLSYVIGVDAVGGDALVIVLFGEQLGQGLALGESARGDDDICEYFGVLGAFVGDNSAYAAGADDYDF